MKVRKEHAGQRSKGRENCFPYAGIQSAIRH
jgi:hypothetical protein